MIRFLGELWWDYNNKPFNYRGIICLESTVAWGFYAIGIVQFVHDAMYHIIDRVQLQIGKPFDSGNSGDCSCGLCGPADQSISHRCAQQG